MTCHGRGYHSSVINGIQELYYRRQFARIQRLQNKKIVRQRGISEFNSKLERIDSA